MRTSYPGISCVVPPTLDGANCIDLIFFRPGESKLRSHYLSRFFNSAVAKAQVQAGKIGLMQQHFSVGAVKGKLISLTTKDEQDEIIDHLELIASKYNLAASKWKTMQGLFYTLFHELMTAKKRVHNLAIK